MPDHPIAPRLCGPREAEATIARLFAVGGDRVTLAVHEDICFKEPLPVGIIHLKPNMASEPGAEGDAGAVEAIQAAIRHGFYEWDVPPISELIQSACQVMGEANNGSERKIHRALLSVVSVAARVGLIHPRFDAEALALMPLRTPTTIVLDTSAILHGGLDFAVRFLYPAARLKVPAIAHMEIHNETDRYFKQRRGGKKINKVTTLYSHVGSQGGQRALLRMELLTDAEIERSALFSDPLRYAFQVDKDSDLRDLNIAVPMRSYCDRLILETARQHQSQVSVGHPVVVMTSDQGLARMALAEGIQPIFFTAPGKDDCDGGALPGVCFHPFSGKLYGVPLTSLLWELAVTFGSARLSAESGAYVDIQAMGQELSWQPFHSRDDLLWLVETPVAAGVGVGIGVGGSDGDPALIAPPAGAGASAIGGVETGNPEELDSGGSYRFKVEGLFSLVVDLARTGKMTSGDARSSAGAPEGEWRNYTGFLVTGGFIEADAETIRPLEPLRRLADALVRRDFRLTAELLLQVPSFRAFSDAILGSKPLAEEQAKRLAGRAYGNYRTLHELAGLGLTIPGEGTYATQTDPDSGLFLTMALACYRALAGSDLLVSTGRWLEALVRDHGVHPLVARQRLAEAIEAGLLTVVPQGASPDRRFERHRFWEIDVVDGKPRLSEVRLYRGTFLFPDKASVDLRLDKRQP